MNRGIFLDASFWIAMRNDHDANFLLAKAIARRLVERRLILTTTLLVAAETHAYFSRSRRRFVILDDSEDASFIRMEGVGPEDRSSGTRLLRDYQDKEFSLCDAVSFAVMERLGMRKALSFDRHFKQYPGVEIINDPDQV